MQSLASRRWIRFRLSTILILTAIAAWAMALRPWIRAGVGDLNRLQSFGWVDSSAEDAFQIALTSIHRYSTPNSTHSGIVVEFGPNPGLLGPIIALAAFLAWKAGWVIAARRRARQEFVL